MATAIINGVLQAGTLTPSQMGFYDVSEEKRRLMTERGLTSFSSVEALCKGSEYLLLSVKPQVAGQVLDELRGVFDETKVLISIAAGISPGFLKQRLGDGAHIVPVMPNTPLLVMQGAVAISFCPPTTREQFEFAKLLFSGAGSVEELPADKLNEVIPVNSSAPAYIYLFAKYFCEYAQRHGIDPDTANRLFCKTLVGSAAMMTETGKSHQELIDMVCSPKGTTLMGIEALERAGIKQAIDACCEATVRRAYELGQ